MINQIILTYQKKLNLFNITQQLANDWLYERNLKREIVLGISSLIFERQKMVETTLL